MLAQQPREVRRLNGPTEIVALEFVAGALLQELGLLPRLDALGDDGQAQRAPHRNDRVGDADIFGVAGNVANERAIDLDRIDREFLQIGFASAIPFLFRSTMTTSRL